MAYDVEKLKSSKAGQTAETSDKEVAGAGLYRHPNGTELITIEDPLFGNAQAEAAMRVGFEYVRPALEGEVKSIVEIQKEVVNPVTQAQEDKARLDQLELAELRREKREREDAEAATVAEAKAKATVAVKLKAEAEAKAKADAQKGSK